MKNLICISGLAGAVLMIGILLGIIMDYSLNIFYLIIGLTLLGAICIVLRIVGFYRRNKKIKEILKRTQVKHEVGATKEEFSSKKISTGLKNISFRKRKSGLSWGGGNIHGANAKRGERKSFLKR